MGPYHVKDWIMKKDNPSLPIEWIENTHAKKPGDCEPLARLLPPGITGVARQFHRQLDGYRMSPLKSLSGLAAMLGIGGIWVKDESQRLSLNSFKVLGGSQEAAGHQRPRTYGFGAEVGQGSFANRRHHLRDRDRRQSRPRRCMGRDGAGFQVCGLCS